MNDAEAPASAAGTVAVAPRARLFRKYAALFASLVAVALIASGAIEVWFSYQENKAALLRIQREKAEAAAAVIEQFVKEVEAQIGWTTHAAFAPGAESLAQRRVDYLRLLRQAPAITEIGYLDAQGREQVLVSRLAMDVVGSNKDLSADPKFSAARTQGRYLSAVYFRKESEPYMTFGLAGRGRDRGVTVAEVNLKFIWDVVSRIKVGREGHAYVVDAGGLLIAHPDISLVLRKTDLSSLLQVRAARAAPAGVQTGVQAREPGMIADDHAGRPVLASSAAIAPVGWTVLVESPLREAFAPLYDSMVRTGILLVVGIALSALAGLWLARRMVGPIQALASGAARIGAGELGRRIDIKTGDELEALADQFNRMGTRLQESYATLERRVEDRTRDLSEALERQTASADILRGIASSPGDAERVLQTIAGTAHKLFGAFGTSIARIEGETFRQVAAAGGTPPAFLDRLSGQRLTRLSVFGRAALEKRIVQVEDLQQARDEFPENPAFVARTLAVAPLLREGEAIGTIGVARSEVRPFNDKQLELLASFADQAVIAIENARLLDELQARMRELSESLEQQTATSEVLRVIASSPGEAERILDTIARTAHRLFAAQGSTITRIDGGVFRSVAATGEPAEFLRANIYERPISRDTAVGRAVLERRTIHIEDIRTQHSEFPGTVLQQAGVRTLLVTPLMREGEAIGTIGVRRNEVRPFSAKEIELLESFAAQAVIAIENARLLDELNARMRELSELLEQQTATSEVLRAIASSPGEAERVLDTISRTALRLVGGLTATIMSVDGEVFREVAAAGESSHAVGKALSGLRVDRRLPAGRAIVERQTIHIEDVQLQADEYPLAPYVREGLGGRAILATPLMREGEAIGTITVTRSEARPFTAKEIELLESFAAQAVIAIENARLLDELQARMRDLSESLEQQTATSEVLRVIASSPSEPERVLDTIARTTARLFEDTGAGIRLVEGNVLRLVGSAGSAVNQLTSELPTLPIDRSTPSGLALSEKRQIQIEDAAAAHEFAYADNMLRAGIRTIVATPMLRGGDAIGVLNVYRTTVRPFGDKELQLIASFADQAVIAIENARLLDELQARTRELARSVDELKALGAVGQAVNSTLDLQKVLDTVLVNASTLSDAGGGAIYAYDEAKGEFELQAAHGMPDDLLATIRGLRIRLGETAVGQCAARREAVQIPDLQIEGESYPLREALSKAGVRSLLAVPLLREDAIVGALVVRRKRAGEFAKETVDLLQAFASQSTLAIQNARLFLEIEQKSRELEIASQHKSQFLANMSHELRTPLNAILGYTELIVDEVYGATNDKIRGVLERVQANGRHLLGLINDVLDLSKIEAGQLSLSLADYSLGDVIQTVVTATEPLAAEKRLAVKLAVPKDLPHGLGDERRIAQVLLNLVGNAIKFTDAGEVGIAASATNGAFEVAVSDTGPGIPPGEQSKIFEEFHQVDSSSTRKKGGTGLGLSIARKIVEMHGGRIWVDSEVGHGSTFRFTLQVRCAEKAEAK